jgi:hypothetical protein
VREAHADCWITIQRAGSGRTLDASVAARTGYLREVLCHTSITNVSSSQLEQHSCSSAVLRSAQAGQAQQSFKPGSSTTGADPTHLHTTRRQQLTSYQTHAQEIV